MKLHILAAALFTAAACHAGIDPANFDTSVKPQDDFYQYAVGGWLKNTPIPADHAGYGSGYEVYDRNQAILRGIVEKAATAKDPGFIEKLVGDFYYSGMDLATVDSVGRSSPRRIFPARSGTCSGSASGCASSSAPSRTPRTATW
jgi:predicted metalloendopeptidase